MMMNASVWLTSGHANLRMLSPSVCRLTLALVVFCRGRSSPIFPCTSLEIGNKTASSAERSSKCSACLAALEKGHSPDILSSFSFAQNIFPAVFSALLFYLFSEGDSLARAAAAAVSGRHSIIWCAHPGYLPSSSLIQMISTRATYNIHRNLLGQMMAGNYHHQKPMRNWEGTEQQANPCATGDGVAQQPISNE